MGSGGMEIVCPCCETKLKVDKKTGEVIWEEKKQKEVPSLADMVKDLENLFGPEALPEPWPEKNEGTWIRKFDSAYGLLESVNWIHGEISWLLPSSRMRISETYKVDESSS